MMADDEIMAVLRAVRHKLLELFRERPHERVMLLDDDGEPGAVIVPAEWYERAALLMATAADTPA